MAEDPISSDSTSPTHAKRHLKRSESFSQLGKSTDFNQTLSFWANKSKNFEDNNKKIAGVENVEFKSRDYVISECATVKINKLKNQFEGKFVSEVKVKSSSINSPKKEKVRPSIMDVFVVDDQMLAEIHKPYGSEIILQPAPKFKDLKEKFAKESKKDEFLKAGDSNRVTRISKPKGVTEHQSMPNDLADTEVKIEGVELKQLKNSTMEMKSYKNLFQISEKQPSKLIQVPFPGMDSVREFLLIDEVESQSTTSGMARKFSNSEIEKAKMKKSMIVEELIDTERSYVNQLSFVVNEYMNPLKSQNDCGITNQQISTIFSDIPRIYAIHMNMLKEFESSSIEDIAQVFLRKADFLKMYTFYLSQYEKSVEELRKLKQNKKFQKFLKEKEASAEGNEITGFLILPVQRIPRYELLLKELKKYTNQNDREFADLSLAFEKIKEIANHVNSTKRDLDNAAKLQELQLKIGSLNDKVQMVNPGRDYISEYSVKSISPRTFRSASSSPRILYLLSDILFLTNLNHKLKKVWLLRQVRLAELLDKSDHMKNLEENEVLLNIFDSSKDSEAGSESPFPNQVTIIFNDYSEMSECVREILLAQWKCKGRAPLSDIADISHSLDEDHEFDETMDLPEETSGFASLRVRRNATALRKKKI